MLTEDKITEIFVIADEFCKVLMRCSVAEVFRRFVRTGSGRRIIRDCQSVAGGGHCYHDHVPQFQP